MEMSSVNYPSNQTPQLSPPHDGLIISKSSGLNSSALLEQYQDDDITSDLLNAIRSWNLERPVNNDDFGHYDHPDGASTVVTTTDIDTMTSASNSRRSLSANTVSSPGKKLAPQLALGTTPFRGNYSSRASSLTTRIISGDTVPQLPEFQCNTRQFDEIQREDSKNDGFINFKQSPDLEIKGKNKIQNNAYCSSCIKENCDCQIKRKGNSKEAQCPEMNVPVDFLPSFQQTEATRILHETALALGLPKDNVDAILPTVRILVRVVNQHMPRMEKFAQDVCNLVLSDEENDEKSIKKYECKKDVNNGNNSSHLGRRKLSKEVKSGKEKQQEKKKMIMEARRKRMALSLEILKKKISKNKIEKYLDNHAVGDEDDKRQKRTSPEKSQHSKRAVGADAKFHKSIMEELVQRKNHQRIVCDGFESSGSLSSKFPRNEFSPLLESEIDALQSIRELIEFENRFFRLRHVEQVADVDPGKSSKNSQHTEEGLKELFETDAATLRRFVLHFMYLFSTRQNEIISKMNELYIFSHEANNLFECVKKALCISNSCPIYTVTKRLMEIGNIS